MRAAAKTGRLRTATIGGCVALVGVLAALLLAAEGIAPDRAEALFHHNIPCVPTLVTPCDADEDIIPGDDVAVPCIPGSLGPGGSCDRDNDLIPGDDVYVPCIPTPLDPCETDEDIIPGDRGAPCLPTSPNCPSDRDIIPGDPVGAVTGAVGGAVERVVEGAINTIFGFEGNWITDGFIRWLIQIPPLGTQGSVADFGATTTAIAFGLLAAVLTLAVIHYWTTGLSLTGGGGGEAPLEAIQRTVAAALFILAWPWAFARGMDLANDTSALVLSATQLDRIVTPLAALLPTGDLRLGLGGFLVGIIWKIAGILVLLAVMVMKVGFTAGGAVLFVAMPFAIALWPLPATKWIAPYALKACIAIALVPVVWALCLGVFAAVVDDMTGWAGLLGIGETLVKALVAMAVLVLMLSLPRTLLRAAGVGSGGGGFLAHTASFMAGHFLHSAVAQHVPDALGGKATSIAEQRQRQSAQDARNAWLDARTVARDQQFAQDRQDRANRQRAGDEDRAWREHGADPHQAERTRHARTIATANQRLAAQQANQAWDNHARAERAARVDGRATPEDVAADLRAYRESIGRSEPFAAEASPGLVDPTRGRAAAPGGSFSGEGDATEQGRWTPDGTFVSAHDGLPTHPGTERFGDAAGDVAQLKDLFEQTSEDPRGLMEEEGRAAIGAIATNAPQYLEPTLKVLADHGDDPPGAYTTARLVDAHSADGLDVSVSNAFATLAAIDEDLRPGLAADFRREYEDEGESD